MLGKQYVYISALTLLAGCNAKTTDLPVAESDTVSTNSIVALTESSVKFLNLDTEQYQVFQEGDTTITLPAIDLIGAPKDREPNNIGETSGVKRQDEQLLFTLGNGGQKVLTSNLTDEENAVEYIFIESLDAIGYWEVLVF